MREADMKVFVRASGKVPSRQAVVKSSRPERRDVRVAEGTLRRRSWRWAGQRPPGPPAAQGGKDAMARVMWSLSDPWPAQRSDQLSFAARIVSSGS
jgi:hypothetical protein